MEFNELLSSYLIKLDISQKDLAIYSGLSEASITRYVNGIRKPKYNSKQTKDIVDGLIKIAKEKGLTIKPYDELLKEFNSSLSDGIIVDYDVFLTNLNNLLKQFKIRNNELARGIYNDSSHISKILSGTRRPGDLKEFINEVSNYITNRIINNDELDEAAYLLSVDKKEISNSSKLHNKLVNWLGSSTPIQKDNSFSEFLTKLDDFDLNDYMKTIHYDDIKLPPSIPHLPTRKEYLGIQKMMESEIDFMKTTVLSKTKDDCILYSDMPIEEMANDPDFPKRYMIGLALMLKKGLHIHIIHDINRPFNEMMIGLQNWIPLYMTGQISPYYLPSLQNSVFLHFLKVSGVAALEGNAIAGNQKDGRYVLYRSKEDVKHYQKRAKDLLNKAKPLMDIYLKDNKDEYISVINKSFNENKTMVCSNIPIYLLPQEVINRKDINKDIKEYCNNYLELFKQLISKHKVYLSIPHYNKDNYDSNILSTADCFIDKRIEFNFEDYQKTINYLNDLSKQNKNFVLDLNTNPIFHNINYSIIGDKMVIVSKENTPTIHFVIYHNKMIKAFQRFVPKVNIEK